MMRKFLLTTLCFIWAFLFPLNAFAESGYVGDEFKLDRPSLPYNAIKVRRVIWNGLNQEGISGYETSSGAQIRITSYFESSKSIYCQLEYEWKSGDRTLTSHVDKTYTINCLSVRIDVANKYMTMKVGQKQYINYSLSPSKGATLRFTSNNNSVATVNSSGEVTAVGTGSATITISQNMGPDEDCFVTVTEPVPATSISLPQERGVDVYSSITLSPTLQPAEANPTLKWKSSDESIASVNQNGKVTGNKPGTATITVTTDNDLSASCTVTVKDVDRTPTSFDISDDFSQKTLYVGDTWKIPYAVTPSYARYTARWVSSDETVATVSYGTVKALKPGKTKITVTIDDTALTDFCEVTVKDIPNVLTIWLANGERNDIKLSEHINVAFEADKFLVKSATVDVVYDNVDVTKFTLENDGSEQTAIKQVVNDETHVAMSYDGNAIYLSGLSPNSSVMLYSVNGHVSGSYRCGQDGSLLIPLDGLSRGIHIVKTESITYKIIKK